MPDIPVLDATDIAILNHLQADGRRSFTDMAQDLNMSVGAVRNRVVKLMEQGTLRIIGKVDPYHVGWNAPATIELSTLPGYAHEVVEALKPHREVTYIASISGEYNLMIDVMCRDNAHFERWVNTVLNVTPGVQRIKTTMILTVHKYASAEVSLAPDVGQETP
ncbi:MAG: Lrp/AsnC family transcriptional regulator [Chloroflexota bacterium]|nr:Lrp/AsnC family transcriptional regulator [Chloroflexota bacterium]